MTRYDVDTSWIRQGSHECIVTFLDQSIYLIQNGGSASALSHTGDGPQLLGTLETDRGVANDQVFIENVKEIGVWRRRSNGLLSWSKQNTFLAVRLGASLSFLASTGTFASVGSVVSILPQDGASVMGYAVGNHRLSMLWRSIL